MMMPRYNTQQHGFTTLRGFFEYIYKFQRAALRVTDTDREEYEVLACRYLTEPRDYEKDIIRFFKAFNGRTTTMYTKLSIISCFLKDYGINVDKTNIKRRIPKNFQRTQSPDMTLDVVRRILAHSDELLRALILVGLSSGMRVGEICRMRLEDITPVPNETIYKVMLEGDMTKSGHDRITFINQETMDAINEWLLVRDKYMKKARNNKIIIYDKIKYKDLLFPLCRNTVTFKFVNALKRADLYEKDSVTNKTTIHFHLLRSMFFTHLIAAGCPVKIADHFIHHSGDYDRFNTQILVSAYKQACHALTVGVDQDTRKQNECLTNMNEKLTIENNDIKSTNDILQKQVVAAMELLLPLLKESKALS